MRVRYLLIAVVALFVVGMLGGSSYAKIDPGTVMGLWLFDEGKGDAAKDSSGRGHDGKFVGDPKWDKGKFGGELYFDGDDTVEVSHSGDFDLETMTIAAWINISEQTGAWQQIVMKQGARDWQTDRNFMIEVHQNSGKLRATISYGNQASEVVGQTVRS